jgi:hypothetical protein
MSAGGGGAGAGSISYPEYLETLHSAYIGDGVLTAAPLTMTDALDAIMTADSPYASYTVYNPTPDLDAVSAEVEKYRKAIKEFDPDAEFENASIMAGSRLNPARRKEYLRATARFKGMMSSVMAGLTSTFVLASAQMESDYINYVSEVVLSFISQYLNLKVTALNAQMNVANLMATIAQNRIQIQTGYREKKVEAVAKNLLWDYQNFQPLSNAVASIGGGTVDPNLVTYTETAMDKANLSMANYMLDQLKESTAAAKSKAIADNISYNQWIHGVGTSRANIS